MPQLLGGGISGEEEIGELGRLSTNCSALFRVAGVHHFRWTGVLAVTCITKILVALYRRRHQRILAALSGLAVGSAQGTPWPPFSSSHARARAHTHTPSPEPGLRRLYQKDPTLSKRVCIFSPLQAAVFSSVSRSALTMLMKKTHFTHTHTHARTHIFASSPFLDRRLLLV